MDSDLTDEAQELMNMRLIYELMRDKFIKGLMQQRALLKRQKLDELQSNSSNQTSKQLYSTPVKEAQLQRLGGLDIKEENKVEVKELDKDQVMKDIWVPRVEDEEPGFECASCLK